MILRKCLSILLLSTLFSGCGPANNKKNILERYVGKKEVWIYLDKLNLDSVPKEIGQLKAARKLIITRDSTSGWVIYPPHFDIEKLIEVPPFRKVPEEITELTKLRTLRLLALDLSELPEKLYQLTELDTLDLSMNKLTISNEIERLTKLKK